MSSAEIKGYLEVLIILYKMVKNLLINQATKTNLRIQPNNDVSLSTFSFSFPPQI